MARGRGHVVTLGSTAGLKIAPGNSVYSATKYAVRALTEGLGAARSAVVRELAQETSRLALGLAERIEPLLD